MLAIIVCN